MGWASTYVEDLEVITHNIDEEIDSQGDIVFDHNIVRIHSLEDCVVSTNESADTSGEIIPTSGKN